MLIDLAIIVTKILIVIGGIIFTVAYLILVFSQKGRSPVLYRNGTDRTGLDFGDCFSLLLMA